MSILLDLQVRGVKRVLRGHDHFWTVIQKIGKGGAEFTAQDIAELSDVAQNETIYDFMRRLESGGYIERVGKHVEGKVRSAVYELRKPQEKTPQVTRDGRIGTQGRGQAQMWNVMRRGKPFSANELAVHASTDEVRVAVSSAKRYAQELERAGYLSVRDPGSGSRPTIYLLKPAHNTGPRPPAILRAKAVWDQNRNEIMGRVLAEEVSL